MQIFIVSIIKSKLVPIVAIITNILWVIRFTSYISNYDEQIFMGINYDCRLTYHVV